MTETPVVAYFSMEIGLESPRPTYAGGLGVLAGDTLRAAADLEGPMVAVTLLHPQGYFSQRLDAHGRQSEESVHWSVEHDLALRAPRVTVTVASRPVQIRAWRSQMGGVTGFQVPVYLLDTDLPENTPDDRTLTHVLSGGDSAYRLGQEMVLGLGGVRMLRALGYQPVARFHMNEGHAALLILALLEEQLAAAGPGAPVTPACLETVRTQWVFTTHTPVPAGHDPLPSELAQRLLGVPYCDWLPLCGQETGLNMWPPTEGATDTRRVMEEETYATVPCDEPL
jgi:starch phosphorylase